MSEQSSVHTLEVRASSHRYPVLIGRDFLGELGPRVAALRTFPAGCACGVITDDTVAPLFSEPVLQSLRAVGFNPSTVIFPAGESSKSLEVVSRLSEALIAHGIDRHGFIVALGGGVTGDLAGFVASIYYRGVPYVQIPTTVVAQVDSAIGGKTGVNTVSGKNLLGAFHAPALVLVDTSLLDTLPPRVFDEGFAEVIKHGIIRDRALFEQLFRFHRDDKAALTRIIRRNLEIKADIVGRDEYERLGLRALLNFGHTIGHGIEQAGGYGRYLHGEAVSLGIVAAARLSMEKAGLPKDDFRAITHCLGGFQLPTTLEADVRTEAVLASLRRDKKFEAGAIRFVLTPGIGRARLSAPGEVSEQEVRAAIEALREPAA